MKATGTELPCEYQGYLSLGDVIPLLVCALKQYPNPQAQTSRYGFFLLVFFVQTYYCILDIWIRASQIYIISNTKFYFKHNFNTFKIGVNQLETPVIYIFHNNLCYLDSKRIS